MAPFLDDVDHVPDLDTQVHRDIFVIEKIFSIHSLRNLPSGFQCQVFRGKGRMENRIEYSYSSLPPFAPIIPEMNLYSNGIICGMAAAFPGL